MNAPSEDSDQSGHPSSLIRVFVKTQISLGIHPVSSESSMYAHLEAKDLWFLRADSENSNQAGQMLCAHLEAKDLWFLRADSKDSDQAGQMPRLMSLSWDHRSFCSLCHAAV